MSALVIPIVTKREPGTPSSESTPTDWESLPLSEQNRQYLIDRAVKPHVALRAGLHSVSAAEAGKAVGRATALASGGLAIPYPNSPDYCRVRLDVPGPDGKRFMAPAGTSVPLYIPVPAVCAESQQLYVVEGPIKALALLSEGLMTVGLGGVSTTLVKDKAQLGDSWRSIELDGRPVTIVFDAGRAENPVVAAAEARLAMALENAGAIVRLASLPLAPGGKDQGPDDFLAREGAEALKRLLHRATPADPLTMIEFLLEGGANGF